MDGNQASTVTAGSPIYPSGFYESPDLRFFIKPQEKGCCRAKEGN